MEHFAYYTIRVRLRDAAESEISGVMERLGSRERRAFENSADLPPFLAGRTIPVIKMPFTPECVNGGGSPPEGGARRDPHGQGAPP
jgi:hypothetical protein